MVSKIQIIWGHRAKNDLKDIHLFYAAKSKKAAGKVIDSIIKAAESIMFAEQYQVDEFLGNPYRRLIVKHCKIVYRFKNNTIVIFRVFDTRQHPSKLK